MPVLLTHDDLHQLFFNPEETAGLVDAADAALREDKPPADRENRYIVVPLQGEGVALVGLGDTSPEFGVTVRAQVRGPNGRPVADSDGLLLEPVLLFDSASGDLQAIVCSRDLEYVRFSMQSAVGCRYLAPPDPRLLGVMGSSVQARAHIPVLLKMLPSVDEVRIYSPTREHRERLARDLDGSLEANVRAVATARGAVEEADVLLAAANSDEPTFDVEWLKPGGLVVSVSRRQLPPEIAQRARIFPITLEGFAYALAGRERATDRVGHHHSSWQSAQPAGSLADVMRGDVPAREREEDTVLFTLTGSSGIEAALARHALKWAAQRGLGTTF